MRCKACGRSWPFGRALLSSIKVSGKKECPHCGEEHYSTKRSYHRSGILAVSAFFVFMLLVETFQMRLTSALFFAVFLLLLVLFIQPLVIHLSDEEVLHKE
ncbi:TIGR04104 family putative zinc finger protein [Halobacillus sp. HZG1]|uniref:TIGR04104 family putative zinc finger protein n=1 Tax=Halobacillus sp. HZG1 TaxID=3111769 RepID=UPI002DBFDC99|nr:TIGR04104 family putative zinc finger protein [Halobacillus sp. HZG1]MEC3885301.1 TIGR04104 family putative zinc finger protein [Halobacillus sp. HZG1]